MKNRILIFTTILLSVTMTSCYDFNRKQAELDAESNGKQILLEAESSKKAKIEEAKAEYESAQLDAKTMITKENAKAESRMIESRSLAQTRIIDAESKAKANEIITKSLTDEFLKYMMIDELGNVNNKVYIPTEAGIPILEAK